MEPQGRGNVPALQAPERNKRLGLSKTTLESRVHVQTSWAECRDKKVSAPSRRGDISLDIPFYRASPVSALTRHWPGVPLYWLESVGFQRPSSARLGQNSAIFDEEQYMNRYV